MSSISTQNALHYITLHTTHTTLKSRSHYTHSHTLHTKHTTRSRVSGTIDLEEVCILLVKDDIEFPLVRPAADDPTVALRTHHQLAYLL